VGRDEYICELIPKGLLIHRHYAAEWEEIEKLEIEKEAKTGELECLGSP